MTYEVLILRHAQRELARLPAGAYARALAAMRALSAAPRPDGASKLEARDGWRIRAGDYRIIYEIDDGAGTVTVLHVGHRRDVYR